MLLRVFCIRGIFSGCDYSVRSVDVVLGEPSWIDLSGQHAAQPSDGIFDASFLPGRMFFAEVGLHGQAVVEPMMVAELSAVIEGHAPAQRSGQHREVAPQLLGDGRGRLTLLAA